MSVVNKTANKTIAKNTLLLYVRMFFMMIIGLYASRVVLRVLGVDDYGVYNVVGGFVFLLSYIKSGFSAATQRYLNFALGQNDSDGLKNIFSNSLTIYIIFSLITIVLAETFGLWYMNNHIVIAPERIVAANYVFQCTMLMMILEMIGIPYNTCIIAHEHMNVYAIISIVDCVLRLAVVLALMASPFDNLIFYALLMLLASSLTLSLYVIYCKKHFEECHYKFTIDKSLLKGMFIFQGWSALGTLGFSFKDQIINIILNNLLGPALSAARAIANQVSGAINQFSTSIILAVTPQITQRYAAGELEESRMLVYLSSKFSFFLMAIVVVPLILNLRCVLQLWLDDVPSFAYAFVFIILVGTLIASLAAPVTTALMATGKIKTFQIGISIIFLIEIPITYYLLKIGCEPYVAIMPCILTQFAGVVFRFWVLHRQVPGYSLKYFYLQIVLRSIVIVSIGYALGYYLQQFCGQGFFKLIASTLISVVLLSILIYLTGMNKGERYLVRTCVKEYVDKREKR